MENSKFINIGQTLTDNIQVQFREDQFKKLLYEKGYNVIHEKCLVCPCKSESSNQLSSCKNCGGSGFLYINPRNTRMVLQSISIENDFKAWSQEAAGTINITAAPEDELTVWDRITVLDGISIFSQNIKFYLDYDGKLKGVFSYIPKEIDYIALFDTTITPLIRLYSINDYTINKYEIVLNDSFLENFDENNPYSITVRYKHAPVYHVLEMRKEMMLSKTGFYANEKNIYLPVSAMARRSHYIERLKGISNNNNLIDNNFSDETEC